MAGKHRFSSEINVVPYIDVMLVLLVIFMVTTPLLTQGVKVELPQANSEPLETPKDEPTIVSMKKDGSLYINVGADKEAQRPLEEIQNSIRIILAAKPDTAIYVWSDQGVDYGKVVTLMSRLQEVGVKHVGLVTEPMQ